MKTQIIKIIPCLLAGFILSGCVGAVNVPSEVAEKVIKTTDPDPVVEKDTIVIVDDKEPEPKPEPIVISPEVALINRCIMDDNANDASCSSIVSEHSCIRDPFGVACDITFTDYYKTAKANRITFCNDNTGDSLCTGDYVADICDYDLFSKVCGDSYHSPREIVCGDEPQSPRCTNTISRVCDDDVFHTLCDTHAIYEPTRINHCITNDNAGNTNCKRAFTKDSCVLNPFGAGCDAQELARTMRESFCRESGNSANPVCVGAVLSLCGDNPFDRLCGESYNTERETACAGDLKSRRCTATIGRVCNIDSLDALCNGNRSYYSEQRRACKNKPNSEKCAPIIVGLIMQICDSDAFDDLCVSNEKYNSAREIVCRNDKTDRRCNPTIERVCGVNVLDGLCDGNETYFTAQKTACAGEPNSNRCAPIITGLIKQVCDADSLDVLCHGNRNYYYAQYNICEGEPNSPRCTPIIANLITWACNNNPFNDSCDSSYNSARARSCRQNNIVPQCESTIEQVCGVDVLDSLCAGNETYYSAQKMACVGESPYGRCRATFDRVCNADSLDSLCDGNSRYYTQQARACRDEPNSARCEPTIRRVCISYPLNALCVGNLTIARICGADVFDKLCGSSYNSAREMTCADEPNSNRCAQTIRRICTADKFDDLCGSSYNSIRKLICGYERTSTRCRPTVARVCGMNVFDSLCNGSLAQKTACESEPNSDRCVPVIRRVCIADVLDALCDGNANHDSARQSACRYSRNSDKCAQAIVRVCESDSLNVLCDGDARYNSARERVCADEPNSPRCYPTLDRVCEVNAFGSLCQSSNLTPRHLPTRPNYNFDSRNNNDPSGSCRYDSFRGYVCYGLIPSVINIKPLNNTNTGMATYAGRIHATTPTDNSRTYTGNNHARQDIDINVNFDDKTLSSSGDWRLGFTSSFSINGNFTDRGQITGSVEFRFLTAPLIGLIGQDELIGVFATADPPTTNGRFNSDRFKVFSGGFKATRE